MQRGPGSELASCMTLGKSETNAPKDQMWGWPWTHGYDHQSSKLLAQSV